ncbi:MAG TPA: YggS family pyridoxal phosphate-dependent enzyme [Candidatus Dormibacteraeota bacterium]
MSSWAAADLLAERLAWIRERMGRAAQTAGRDPGAIRLLAVTKGHPAGAIEAAVALGLCDIGESRVQEATVKRAAVAAPGVTWHMVGHLQRNKARAAAALFDTVHSLDSAALATALARHRDPGAGLLRVFIEVELTGLPGRTGVEPAQAGALLDAVRDLAALEAVGLMTIAPPGAPDAAGRYFSRLRDLRDALRESHGVALDELSMGMSADFEVAIAQGATIIRLGRALFGGTPLAG